MRKNIIAPLLSIALSLQAIPFSILAHENDKNQMSKTQIVDRQYIKSTDSNSANNLTSDDDLCVINSKTEEAIHESKILSSTSSTLIYVYWVH